MKVLSLKLKDEIFQEAEKMIKEINISRNAYINDAVALYNKLLKRKKISKQLGKESKLVQEESLRALKEWEFIDDHLIP